MINRLAGLPAVPSVFGTSNEKKISDLRLEDVVQPVEQLIVKHSGLALIVAFAVGVTIACLVKRR